MDSTGLSRTWKELRPWGQGDRESFRFPILLLLCPWQEALKNVEFKDGYKVTLNNIPFRVQHGVPVHTDVCTHLTESADLQICAKKKKLHSQHYAQYTEKSVWGSQIPLICILTCGETDLLGVGQATTVWGILNALPGTINSFNPWVINKHSWM